jgi:hypothetical protein
MIIGTTVQIAKPMQHIIQVHSVVYYMNFHIYSTWVTIDEALWLEASTTYILFLQLTFKAASVIRQKK